MDYLEIAKMAMQEYIPFITTEPIIISPVIIDSIKNKASPVIQNKKIDVTLLAKSLVTEIEGRALNIGWTAEQLTDFTRTLQCFIPASIGTITLRAIEIIILYPDGSPRGAVKFYNHEVDQPWLKYLKGDTNK